MALFKKILLVDDDEDSNFLTKRIIVHSNIADEVTVVLNGKEAYELVKECAEGKTGQNEYPDLVLLDIKMPVMNGVEFLEVCTANNLCNFPVVVLTSSVDERDREDTIKFPNVKDFVNKPLSYEKILEIQKKLSVGNGVGNSSK